MVLTCAFCGVQTTPGCGIKCHHLLWKNKKSLKKLLLLLSVHRKDIPVSKYTRIHSQLFDGRGKKRHGRTGPGRT